MSSFLELSSDSRFIVLSYNKEQKSYFIKLESSLPRVVNDWTPSTRISPLFGIKQYRHKSFSFLKPKNKHFILFIGLISPSRIHEFIPTRCGLWFSLGLFNVVIQTSSSEDKEKILEWLRENKVRFELWTVEKQKVKNIEISSNGTLDYSWRATVSKIAESQVPLLMQDTRNEFCPLISNTLARSAECLPHILDEFKNVSLLISDLLSDTGKNLSEQHETNALLAKTNAGLSRFSSQAFSGTTPITGTECHFWTHSLLGTGVANFSFINLVFVYT